MSKTALFRTLNLSVRLILMLNLILSFVPLPALHSLGRSSGVGIAHAIPFLLSQKRDVLLVDNDGDGVADPGDTLRYTVVLTNSGTTNAGSVVFNDTIDANTTVVPGSVRTTPIARNDGPYASLGNVGITVPASSGVLANDNDPDGTTPTLSVIPAAGATYNSGAFAIGADGSFSYLPPAGFEGVDSFGYTIQDSDGNIDPASVNIVVTDLIWFVDNTAATQGDGRLSSPFNSLDGAGGYNGAAADDPGDVIFIYSGSGSYTGGITLQNNQLLIGQGATASLASISGITLPPFSNALPATGGTRPVTTNSGGSGITLASDNSIRGLAVSNTSGAGIAGSSVNTLTIQEVDVSSAAGVGMHLSNLSGTATLDNLSVIGSNADNILIESNSGTATIHLTNSTVNTAGDDGFAVIGRGTADITFNVSGSSFTHNNAVQLKAHAEDSSTIDVNFTGNAFDGDPAVVGNVGIDLAVRDSAILTFDVIGTLATPQTFQPFRSQVINIFALGGGTASGRVNGNTINGSAFGAGVRAVAEVTDVGGINPSITIEIDGNTISNVQGSGLAGIHVVSRDGSNIVTGTANVQATINNNAVTINGADSVIQGLANGGNTLCLDVTNNSAAGASTSPFAGFGSTHYIGNPVLGDSLGAGTVIYDGYLSGDLGGTWNANGNSPTLATGISGEAFVDGTQPSNGTCATVADLSPPVSGIIVAQANDVRLSSDDSEPTTDGADVLLAAAGLVESFVVRLGDVTTQLVATQDETATEVARTPSASRRAPGLAKPAVAPHASGETINLSLGDLNPGQVVLIIFDVTVDDPLPAAVSIVCNQGVFSGDNFINVLTDDVNVGGVADPTCTAIDREADLSITKTDSPDPATAGQNLIYTLTASNAGPDTANSVQVVDNLPASVTYVSNDCGATEAGGVVTWNVGNLGNGASAVCNITVIPTLAGNITNTASVSSYTYDPESGNNSTDEPTTVNPPNAAPVANNDSYSTNEDTALVEATVGPLGDGVLVNDTDADSESLTAVLDTGTSSGVLIINSDGSFTYTPIADYCGLDSFTYHANDGTDDSNVATVSIDVVCVDDPPVANDDIATVTEDDPATTIDVLGNDTDIDGGPISIASVTQPANGTVVNNGSDLTYQPDPDYCSDGSPTDDFTYTLTPGGSSATVRVTVVCVDDPPVVSVDIASQTVQYSDDIAPVTITATDPDSASLNINASLPSALSQSGGCTANGSGTSCTWTLSGQVLVAAGTYNVNFTVSDATTGVTANTQVVVTPEDATVAFDDGNPVSVPVDSPGGDSGPFSLTVYVTETQPDQPSGSAAPGDISLAEVSITLAPVGPGGSFSGTCTPASVTGTGYDAELAVTCTFDNVEVNTYSVEVTVDGGYYSGSGEDVLVVYDPSLGFTTGGGWFYWPGTQDRTNFGYTMKYNKKGTKVQGSLLLIRHLADGSIYRVKSNALDGLALGDEGSFGWATFSGKSTYLEPGMAEPEGNHAFVAYVEDHGEPGAGADRVWIEVQDKDGNTVTLSMDRAASDNAELLQGGNVVVPHGGDVGTGRK